MGDMMRDTARSITDSCDQRPCTNLENQGVYTLVRRTRTKYYRYCVAVGL